MNFYIGVLFGLIVGLPLGAYIMLNFEPYWH